MNEILIEVFVPSIEQTYDMFATRRCTVYNLLHLIGNTVQSLSHNKYRFSNQSRLCLRSNGKLISTDLTIDEAEIINGTQLLLL